MTEVTEEVKVKRERLSKAYPEDAKITVLADANPKKAGSRAAKAFEAYKDSATVGDFFVATAGLVSEKSGKKAPGSYADIKYDVEKGYIKVG